MSVDDNHNFFANGVLVHNAGTTKDHRVRIIKGGSISSNEDKASGTAWTDTLAYHTYGDSSALWGESWNVSDINSDTFGVAISVYGSGYLDQNYTTYYLKATNFGFSIPSATINGIIVEIKKKRRFFFRVRLMLG